MLRFNVSRLVSAERPPGYDRVRNAEIGNKDFELDVLEEAYTTEHWLVRIYKVNTLLSIESSLLLTCMHARTFLFLIENMSLYAILDNQ